MGGVEKILVIREVPRIRPGFETKLRQNYAAALDKITAEASAKHARTDGEVDRKQELDTLRDNLKALSVSSMGADPYQGEKNSSEIATLIDQVGNLHSLLNSLEAKTILPEEAVGLRAFFMTKQNIREFKTACAACLQSFPEERRAEASVYLGSIKKMYNEALTTVKSNLDSIALSSGHDIDERKGLDMR
ncbi:MAG: hypothetical protein NTZ86_09110 [Legionellales bacterium]|nr:hypothetical protein [Legionellales bacterium]